MEALEHQRLLASIGFGADGLPDAMLRVDSDAAAVALAAISLGDGRGVFSGIPSCWRWTAFLRLAPVLTPTHYWTLLRFTWIYTDNHWEHIGDFRRLWSDPRPERDRRMNNHEHKVWTNLSAKRSSVTLYRGCRRSENEDGWSWCFSREDAQHFAKVVTSASDSVSGASSRGEPLVVRASADLKDIEAVYSPLDRGEFEVVIDPSRVSGKLVLD